ncbi:acyltransferase [Micromonospora sp. WMMD710]|uniref:acyltransferase family protein n=1 Tax=Micromonospora sp. WMMD710 TaxID=3016085 RepID=UPI0024162728|nr:acyltransferase [Micromonospora sp. WMMD710]MDG4756564.1 acyltransferase [Micromonospora sp. WMMD710]
MRNRYLDLLRFLAIVRVVVYHVTGWATLTLVFPAMSVMFALAGSLMAASLTRSGPAAVGRRLRRLLPSLWVLAAVFVPAMLFSGLAWSPRVLLWLFPIADPPANNWGALALSIIWYLRDYLWFVLASPIAFWLFRKAPLPTVVAPYLLLVAIEVGIYQAPPPVLREFGLYFGAWLLGFAHHAGMLRRLAGRVVYPLALALATAGGAWIVAHPGPRGYDLNDNHLGNALWSAAFILIVLGRAPAGIAWLERSRLADRTVTVVNRRALTVYLWHMPFVVALTPLVDVVGWSHQDPLGLAIRVLLVFALVGVVTLVVGWVEDVAARRRPELIPGGPPVPAEPTAPSDAEPAARPGVESAAGRGVEPAARPGAESAAWPGAAGRAVGSAVVPAQRTAGEAATVEVNAG